MLSKSPLIPSLISTYKTLISDEIEVNDQVQEHPVPIFLYFNALCRLLTYFQNLHTGKVAHIQGWTPVWFLLRGFYILLTPLMPFIMAGHYSQKGLQRKKDYLYFVIKTPRNANVCLCWCCIMFDSNGVDSIYLLFPVFVLSININILSLNDTTLQQLLLLHCYFSGFLKHPNGRSSLVQVSPAFGFKMIKAFTYPAKESIRPLDIL